MKFLVVLALAVLVVVVTSQQQKPLSQQEQARVQLLQRRFKQCRDHATSLNAKQKDQCSFVQAELKKFQNVVAQRTGQAPTAEDDAKVEAEINLRLDPNLTLLKITPDNLNEFLRNKVAVTELVNCFESFTKCRHRAGTSLVNDVLKLSRGFRCKTCESTDQDRLTGLVNTAIQGLQNHHPKQWKRLLPFISFLL